MQREGISVMKHAQNLHSYHIVRYNLANCKSMVLHVSIDAYPTKLAEYCLEQKGRHVIVSWF